jgi:hypothetical protein
MHMFALLILPDRTRQYSHGIDADIAIAVASVKLYSVVAAVAVSHCTAAIAIA